MEKINGYYVYNGKCENFDRLEKALEKFENLQKDNKGYIAFGVNYNNVFSCDLLTCDNGKLTFNNAINNFENSLVRINLKKILMSKFM